MHLNFSYLRPRTRIYKVFGISLELFVRKSETSKPYRREQYKTLRPISEKLRGPADRKTDRYTDIHTQAHKQKENNTRFSERSWHAGIVNCKKKLFIIS